MASVQELAIAAAAQFERATRPDGTAYVRTKDDAPEWIREEIVFPAHGDMLPDDWRYETVWLALEWIAERGDTEDDAPGEFADSRVDIYTASACAWLASHLSRPGYCDEATEEFGPPDPPDVLNLIARGQYVEASEVYGLVLSALERIAADTEIPAAIDTGEEGGES